MTENEAKRYRQIIRELVPDLHAISESLLPLLGKVVFSTKQNMYDLVTDLDLQVEQQLVDRLATLDSGVPVVGEERGGDRNAQRYWLIDPIDGTIHFIRGNPFCCTMLSLIEDNVPIVSVIYNIVTRDYYYAIKGRGAYKNEERLATSGRSPDAAMVLVEMKLRDERNAARFIRLANTYKLMNMACAGYEFVMVAEGRAEARLALDPFGLDYDFAPGVLLIQEAGGVVKNLQGADYATSDNDFIAASSDKMYHHVKEVIKNYAKVK